MRDDCRSGTYASAVARLLDGAIAHVVDDADHLGAVVEAALSEADLLPDRIVAAEERARGGFVDDDDLRLTRRDRDR